MLVVPYALFIVAPDASKREVVRVELVATVTLRVDVLDRGGGSTVRVNEDPCVAVNALPSPGDVGHHGIWMRVHQVERAISRNDREDHFSPVLPLLEILLRIPRLGFLLRLLPTHPLILPRV